MSKFEYLLISLLLSFILVQECRTEEEYEDEIIKEDEITSLVFRNGEYAKGPLPFKKLNCFDDDERDSFFKLCRFFAGYIDQVTCDKSDKGFNCHSNLPIGVELNNTNVKFQYVEGQSGYVYKNGSYLNYDLKPGLFFRYLLIISMIVLAIAAILSFITAGIGQFRRSVINQLIVSKKSERNEATGCENLSFSA